VSENPNARVDELARSSPCIVDDGLDMVKACIHAGSGLATIQTKEVDLVQTARNLADYGGSHKERLGLVFFQLGTKCKVMIFKTTIKLRCLETHATEEERREAITEVLTLVTENIICKEA
jgi:hypothetical protein